MIKIICIKINFILHMKIELYCYKRKKYEFVKLHHFDRLLNVLIVHCIVLIINHLDLMDVHQLS